MHVSFTPLSNGSSLFTTNDEILQKAIESHYNFNKLFSLLKVEDLKPIAPKETEKTSSEETEVEKPKTTKVTVSDISVAKDYLADHFGVSRTAMRSTKSILEYAKLHGIEFIGI